MEVLENRRTAHIVTLLSSFSVSLGRYQDEPGLESVARHRPQLCRAWKESELVVTLGIILGSSVYLAISHLGDILVTFEGQ